MKVLLESKEVLEYIRDMLLSSRIKSIDPKEYYYHHNTSYKNTISVIKYGILSKERLAKLEKTVLTERERNLFGDIEAHVNGYDYVSLSVVNLTDLYRDEDEYDPFNSNFTDILISKNIETHRSSTHYGNEFLSPHKVDSSNFRSVDLRILKLISTYERDMLTNEMKIQNLINRYNYISEIAVALQNSEHEIILREMTKENVTLDIDKIASNPKLELIRR